MVLESELNSLLKQVRIQALQDALAASPDLPPSTTHQFDNGVSAKNYAILKLLNSESLLQPTTQVVASVFQIRNLSVLAYANGFTLWNYRGSTSQEIMSPSFFDDAVDMLVEGDIIMCSCTDRSFSVYVASVTCDGTIQIAAC